MKKTIARFKAALAVCVCVCVTTASWAANGVWNGTVDALWTNSNNWSATPYPSGNDTASFTNNVGPTTINVAGLASIKYITFDSPTVALYTIGAGAANSQTNIMVDGGEFKLTDTAANSQFFNAGLQLGTNIVGSTYTLTNGNTSQTLTFNNIFGPASGGTAGAKILAVNGPGNTTILGNITNGGATSLTLSLSGAGTLTLKGTNVYTGNTILNSGTLTLGSDAALPTGNIVSMSGLGTLDLGGYGATINNISASSITNTITDNSSGPGTSTLYITAHGATVNALIKDGPSKAVAIAIANANASIPSFTNSAANTFSGGLTLKNNGSGTRIRISNPVISVGTPGNITSSTFGTGPIIIGEAATDKAGILFDTVGTNTIVNAIVVNTSRGTDQPYALRTDTASNTISGTVTANADVTTGGAGTLTLSNTISGTGGVSLVYGSLILSGVNNYTGITTLTNGTLTLRGDSALPANSPVSLLHNGTLKILQDGSGNNGSITVNNNITLSCPATATIDVGNNGSLNTGNTVAFGALNNGTPLSTFSSTINFTGTNGYLQSFSTLRLTGLTGGSTTLKPTTTSVTILGNVENQESGTVAAHFDTLALDGTSTGNSILGCISDAPGYISVGNGDTRVTKSSTSTWTLFATNTYHGPTTVSAGTLIIGGAGKLGGGVYTNTVVNSGVLNYASSEAQVLSGVISGAGTLIKSGSGMLTLSGINTSSGAITNNNGRLVGVTGGTCSNSSIVVQSIGSGVTASLGVRYTAANAQWMCTNLTTLAGLSSGNAPGLAFAFGSTPSTTLAPLVVRNNLTLDATTTISVDPVNLVSGGVYPLLVYGGAYSGPAPATITPTIGNGLTGTLSWSAKTLVLTVGGTATSADTLRWSGLAGTGTWDINNSVNTNWNDTTTVPSYYQELLLGNPVQFEDSQITADQTVTLNSIVNPMSLIASNSLNRYTVSGSGTIGGATGLTKLGTNTFTLATLNTYFGPTIVNEGVLALSGLGTLGRESPLTLSGGMVDLGGLSASVGPVNIITAPASGITLQNGNLTGSSYVASLESGTATVTANLLGAGTLTKFGVGTLVLSGSNTYSGATTLSAGILTITSNGAINSTAGQLTIGNTITNATLTISGGTVNAKSGDVYVGTVHGAAGVINISAGTLTTSGQAFFGAGGAGTNGFGALNVSGGSATFGNYLALGRSNPTLGQSRGELLVSGGTVTVLTNNLEIGSYQNAVASTCVATLTGGNTIMAASAGEVIVGKVSHAILNVLDNGSLSILNLTKGLRLVYTAGVTGIVNLNGGSITTPSVFQGTGTTSYFNFDGGTLRANKTNATFMTGLAAARVFDGGAVIDDGGFPITIAQPLLSPAASNGVSLAGMGFSGSGFIAPPIVEIAGTGTGASAIAMIDGSGNLTNVTLTCPGYGYTGTPVLTFTGGGSTVTQTGSASTAANTSGGLTKLGTGTLTLSGVNTYSGATVINNGKLVGLTGVSCSNSAVYVAATAGNSATNGVSITDNTKQWTCASLTVTNDGLSSGLEFDYGTIAPSTTLAPLNVLGEAAFKTLPTVTVKIGVNSIGAPGTKYPLMVWDSTTGTTPTAVTVISLRAITGHLEVVGKTLTLVIDANEPIQWALSTAGIWDTLATNWVDGVDAETTYRQTVTPGDQVMFNNNAHIGAHTTVTLNSTVTPANVTVSNTLYNYTITGSGAIAGTTTTLTKLGEGVLTLDTANTYSGGTILSAGQLNINKATAIGAAASRFTINGGLIDNTSAADLTLTANNPQSWNGDFTYIGSRSLNLGAGAVTPNNNWQVTVSSNTLTVGGVISGAYGFTKAGKGTLTLPVNNTYTGNVIVAGGNLNANNTTSLGALAAGRTITVNAGGTLSLNMNNAVSGAPGLTTPAMTVNGGTLYVTRYSASGMAAYNNGLVLQNSATMWVNDTADSTTFNAWQFGDWVTISGTSGSVITNGTGGSSRLDLYTNTTFNVLMTGGTGYDLAVYAPLVNQGMTGAAVPAGLTKDGAGTMALYAANTYTGPTFISNGKLVGVTGGSITSVVTNNAATGTSTLGILIKDNIKQWLCNGLTFTSASTGLDFDFGQYVLPATTTNFAPLKVNGVVNFTAIPAVTVSAGSITGGTNSVYPLMVCSSILGTPPTTVTVNVTTSRGAIKAHLEVIGSTLNLVIDTNSGPLNWATSTAGLWDTSLSNWKLFNGDPAIYDDDPVPGDQVLFSDTFVTANTTVTLDSVVTPTSVSVTNTAYNYILSGNGGITGGAALAKSGSGTLTLGTVNTYSGGTFLNGGSLVLGNAVALPVGSTLSMSGIGTLDLNGYGATLGNIYVSTTGNTITDNSSGTDTNTLSILNQTSITSALIKDGTTKKLAVNLMNANVGNTPFLLTVASTFSGGFTLKNGASLGQGTRLCINGPVTTSGSAGNITSSPFGRGPIIIGEAATDKAGMYITTATTIANDLVVNTPLGTDQPYVIRVDVSTMNLSGRVTANADLTMACQTGTGALSLTNVISGPGGVTMPAGGGTLTVTLTGPNTYLGKTVVNKGTLLFTSIGNVGGGASALGAPTTVANGAIDLSGTLTYTGAATSSDRIINLLGSCTVNNSGTGTLTLEGGFTGGVNYNLLLRGSGTTIMANGVIGHGGYLSKTDNGVLYLNNSANSFTGGVFVADGTVIINSIADSGVLSPLGKGSTIQLGQNTSTTTGTLRFTGASGGSCNRAITIVGNNATVGGIIENSVAGQTLTLSGNVSMGGTVLSPRFQLAGAGNGVLSGNIVSNALSVMKSGAGKWTFTGINSYTGATTVAGGTLVLSGTNGSLTNSLAYAITSGAMLVLENTSALNNTNRLRDASAITLDNGTLSFTNTQGAASYYENAGALSVANSSTIVSAQAAVGMTNILSLGALTRTGSATLNFVGAGIGQSDRNRIFIAGQTNGFFGFWATINTTNYAAYDSNLGVILAGTGTSFTNILAKGPSIIPDEPTLNAWINEEGTGGGITLAAAYTNRIKTLVQNTDWLATVAMTNQTLMVGEVLVSTGNARKLTLGTAVNEGGLTPLTAGGELLLTAAAADSVLTVNAAISNNTTASTITKMGPGTVILAGTNNIGGAKVSKGFLTLAGSLTSGTSVTAGSDTPGTLTINGGTLNCGGNNLQTGNAAGHLGAIYLNSGLVTNLQQILVGGGQNAANYGFLKISGGTWAQPNTGGSPRHRIGQYGSIGLFYQTNGTYNAGSQAFDIANATGISTGVVYLAGSGLINHNGALVVGGTTATNMGILTVDGNASAGFNGSLTLCGIAGSQGFVNLNGGTLKVNSVVLNAAGLLTFNGGILKAGAASTTFNAGSGRALVFSNGTILDTQANTMTISQGLLAPEGSGVVSIPVLTSGSGYIGAPFVGINGDGGGATAIANMSDDGTGSGTYRIQSLTITSPGTNYTLIASVTLAGGGGSGATFDTPGATLAPNISGGLTKLGSGTLTLSGTNTYAGATTISNGTLRLGIANALPTNSVVNVNGGIYDLGGFTVTNGQVNVTSGSIINGTIANSGITVDNTATMTTWIGSRGLTKNGNGTLVLNGPVDNFSAGPLVVNSGTLKLSFGPLNEAQGLSYWLDAADISKLSFDTTNVTAWADSSTNGVNFTQGTAANQPVYMAGVINGLPAVRFNGSSQKMVASKTANAQTVFIVNTPRGYSSLAGIWGATPDTGIRLWNATSWSFPGNTGDFTTGTGQMYINGQAGTNFTVSTPHLLTAISATLRTGWSTMIGNYFTARWFNGDIGELLVYNSALGAVDRQSVEAYLKSKWFGVPNNTGLTVSLADNTILDLSGGSVTLTNLTGSGTVSNGTLTVTGTISPAGTNIGTLTVKAPTTFSGNFLVDVNASTNDCLVVEGNLNNLNLQSPTLEIADLQGLSTIKVYTLATCSGTITGSFVSTNITDTRWALRTTSDGKKVQLYYKGGTMIRIL